MASGSHLPVGAHQPASAVAFPTAAAGVRPASDKPQPAQEPSLDLQPGLGHATVPLLGISRGHLTPHTGSGKRGALRQDPRICSQKPGLAVGRQKQQVRTRARYFPGRSWRPAVRVLPPRLFLAAVVGMALACSLHVPCFSPLRTDTGGGGAALARGL